MTPIAPANGLTLAAVKQLFGEPGLSSRGNADGVAPGASARLREASTSAPSKEAAISADQELAARQEDARGVLGLMAEWAFKSVDRINGALGGFKSPEFPARDAAPGTMVADPMLEDLAQGTITLFSSVFQSATGKEVVLETTSDGSRRVAPTEVERTVPWGSTPGQSYTLRMLLGDDRDRTYTIIDNATGTVSTHDVGAGDDSTRGRAHLVDVWS